MSHESVEEASVVISVADQGGILTDRLIYPHLDSTEEQEVPPAQSEELHQHYCFLSAAKQ